MIKRAQNRIAESRFALLTTAIYALVVCGAAGVISQGWWLQLLLLALSTLMMVYLNNSNALIRIYSRMVSCSFLVMMTMASFLLPSIETMVVQMAFIDFILFFFRAYQDKEAQGLLFYAFCALGIMSLFFVQTLYLVPILIILLGSNMMALSVRTFFASLIGLAMPYWFLLAYDIYIGQADLFVNHLIALDDFHQMFDLALLDSHRLVTLAVVTLFSVVGTVHFLRNSFKDKIRIRMIYESFIVMELCILLLILFQPQHFDQLLGMLIVVASPLIGHFIALTHTRWTNIFFFVIMAIALILTTYNLWVP